VSVTAGDFNNDGRIDLAVANRNCPNNNCGTASVSILMGKPDGTFEPPVDYLLGGTSIDLAVFPPEEHQSTDKDLRPGVYIKTWFAVRTCLGSGRH
jgi:hypothetical protein